MVCLKLFLGIFAAIFVAIEGQGFQVGVGRSDVTGPIVEVPFMGYGNPGQRGTGLQTRQYARAFIIVDSAGRRIVYVIADIHAISHPMKRDVILNLQQRGLGIYTFNNVMLAGTHTHGGPGGFNQLGMYDVTCFGFVPETYNAIVTGIAQSIANAHNSLGPGRVFLTETPVNDVQYQRSLYSYNNNPASERNRHGTTFDRNLVQLRLHNSQNQVIGAFGWMATHAVSMNNENTLVSVDNLGYASLLLEREFNPGQLVGRGNFVGAFATSHSGDVSPNINGPRCSNTGSYCDGLTSTCPGDGVCFAVGPGRDDTESTQIIGSRIYEAGSRMVRAGGGTELTGTVGFVHQHIQMNAQSGTFTNPETGQTESYRGCTGAMGFSFGAGTTDGPGGFDFTQGNTDDNPFWNRIRDFVAEPTADDHACHAPKPILLMVGATTRPYLWVPGIIPTQLFTIGTAVLVGLPSEFSTMAGRRVRDGIVRTGAQHGRSPQVILSGMTNVYASYSTTFEEYQIQRYEGASTMYGPHTNTIYVQQFNHLYSSLINNQAVAPGPNPPDERGQQISLITPVVNDDATGTSFGAVIRAPLGSYRRGVDEVFVTFVSGNPRNNLMTNSSYFHAETLQGNVWVPVATDADWETRCVWRRTNTLLGRSEFDFYWRIPSTVTPGLYRIRHNGASRGPITGIRDYEGTTAAFTITA